MVATLGWICPTRALADDYYYNGSVFTGDIAVGAFFTSDSDMSDTIYGSLDGRSFTKLATAFQQTESTGEYAPGHWCMSDPSIIYKDGYYWMIAGSNYNSTARENKIYYTISYSKDLVNWSRPWGESCAIDSSSIPAGCLGNGSDSVAPDWFVASDGSVYIVVSCGYYGDFHGNATHDIMQPYIAKVDTLSASGAGTSGDFIPVGLNVSIGTAHRLSFSNTGNPNWIDGSLYQEGDTYYLYVKKNGLWNEIYTTTNINDPNSWAYRAQATYGYEGPSVIKLNGTYHMYADGVGGTKPLGVCQFEAASAMQGSWTQGSLSFGGMSARHGTVITVSHDSPAWAVAASLLKQQGVLKGAYGDASINGDDYPKIGATSSYSVSSAPSGTWSFSVDDASKATIDANTGVLTSVADGYVTITATLTTDSSIKTTKQIETVRPDFQFVPVYRMFNPATGEHLYTTDAYEVKVQTTQGGWRYEGAAFFTQSYGSPVTRLFNPTWGKHHYSEDAYEISVITSTQGWRKDFWGAPTFYSGGLLTMHRLFNSSIGEHLYTTDNWEDYILTTQQGWKEEPTTLKCAKAGNLSYPYPG